MRATALPPIVKTAEDLLAEFERTGDASHFEEIVRRYSAMVYGVCYRVTRNAHDAEDAAQAVFLKLATQARTTGNIPRVGPWLQQVAKTTAVDLRRSRTRRVNREQVKAAVDEQQQDFSDASEDLGMDELKQLLRDEVDKLPSHYRTPLILYYFGGLSTDQIAKELGSNAKALAVRLFRGRKMLGSRLKDRGLAPAGAALGGGTFLSLALADAILSAMANANFSAQSYSAAACGTSAGGSSAWLTSHASVFASITERIVAVTRACTGGYTLAGKVKMSMVILMTMGTAMAGSSESVRNSPALQTVGGVITTVRDALQRLGGVGNFFQLKGTAPSLTAAATPAAPAPAAPPASGYVVATVPYNGVVRPSAPAPWLPSSAPSLTYPGTAVASNYAGNELSGDLGSPTPFTRRADGTPVTRWNGTGGSSANARGGTAPLAGAAGRAVTGGNDAPAPRRGGSAVADAGNAANPTDAGAAGLAAGSGPATSSKSGGEKSPLAAFYGPVAYQTDATGPAMTDAGFADPFGTGPAGTDEMAASGTGPALEGMPDYSGVPTYTGIDGIDASRAFGDPTNSVTPPLAPGYQPVPEPATVGLLAAGAAGLLLRRRRR